MDLRELLIQPASCRAASACAPRRSIAIGRAFMPLALWLCCEPGAGQTWQELQGHSDSGSVALQQALLDARSDALALLVASHPDDRYVLPAVYLRYLCGVRVAVLLATRGGGGQNSLGPETGDALERIRTLETEAGCQQFDGDVYYLDRPDLGYRRTAAETFDEWDREATTRELARLLRSIAPDLVLSTHHARETHGHDQALAAMLPVAVQLAADPGFASDAPLLGPCRLYLGAPDDGPFAVRVGGDEFDLVRGGHLRRLAHEILRRFHRSPGLPAPMDTVFGAEMAFAAVPPPPPSAAPPSPRLDAGMASLFDDGIWPADAASAARLRSLLVDELPTLLVAPDRLIERAAAAITALQALPCPPGGGADRRRGRRVAALQRVVRHASGITVEVEAAPGAAAVPGEELRFKVRVHAATGPGIERVSVSSDGEEVLLETETGESTQIAAGRSLQGSLVYRVPLAAAPPAELMEARFQAERFMPPVRLLFSIATAGVVLPVSIAVPVELRPPVELAVVPRMLLLPATRQQVQFTVEVTRHSMHPVEGQLEVRAPAGYRVDAQHTKVKLTDVSGDAFVLTVHAPPERKSGVDLVRISMGNCRVELPLHKVDVRIDQLRIGIVRGEDDALVSVIGIGGFGLRSVDLSDLDLAIGDLTEFDTIVIDVRALRDRPAARRSFRRLIDFCSLGGKRLVVLYHKDTEIQPPGEAFLGAPIPPFQIGRNRVTRPDAPVTILRPEHLLLRQPNLIRAGDWDGWEQERALYLPDVYADGYEEILSMQDPGQPVERASLLYARHGEGEYVYCALALWRQWKKLHAGSVRLLANLLTPSAKQ